MSKLKWWQKGIGLSIAWVLLVFGAMWLHTGANNDEIDERYGQLCGTVLGLGWVIAAVLHNKFWRGRVVERAGKPLSLKMILLGFATAAVVIGFLVYRDFQR